MTMKEIKNGDAGLCGKTLMTELDEKIERYARVSHYVLITGERGTGKTTIAKRLHEKGARAKKEFVNLNCASLTPELLESELFGYEKGAFTGATAPKMGLFEIASGGTVFLDEIGELPLNLQAKLLKAVEEKRIRRVGGSSERAIDARIIAATSQNLRLMVATGRFRADLYDRLNILNLETVPLRFQKDKIKNLLETQLDAELSATGRETPFEISPKAVAVLEDYEWRGNFRELINFATRLAVECLDDTVISAESVNRILEERKNDVSMWNNSSPSGTFFGKAINDFSLLADERIIVTLDPKSDDLDSIYLKAAGSVIQHVLSENDGSFRQAANALGANHSTLSRILSKFNQSYDRQKFHSRRRTQTKRAATAAA